MAADMIAEPPRGIVRTEAKSLTTSVALQLNTSEEEEFSKAI